jgi:hypothetical protein
MVWIKEAGTLWDITPQPMYRYILFSFQNGVLVFCEATRVDQAFFYSKTTSDLDGGISAPALWRIGIGPFFV